MPRRSVKSKSQAPPAKPQMIPSSWYLGGKLDSKLLTSVDGDLDPAVLNKLTAVPKDIGEIALSVESMVSHDFIVGDFERDLLEKIATNFSFKNLTTTPIATKAPEPIKEAPPQVKHQRSPSMEKFSVPNPIGDSNYKPVPNPLAVTISPSDTTATISPPDSPVSVMTVPIPVTISSKLSRKRKSPAISGGAPENKKAARRAVQMTLVAT